MCRMRLLFWNFRGKILYLHDKNRLILKLYKYSMMKKLLIAALVFFASACSQKNPSGDIVINVEVENPTVKEVGIMIDRVADYKIALDDEGCGSLTLSGIGDAFPKIVYGEDSSKKIFLEKGRNVTLKFDSRTFKEEGVKVEGYNEVACDYLQQVTLPKPPDFALNWEPFTADLNQKLEDVIKHMSELKLDRKCPEFFKLEQARLDYMFAHTLIMYPLGHAWKAGEFSYNDTYYDAIRRLIVEREDMLWVDAYRSFLEQGIPVLLEEKQGFKSAYEKRLGMVQYVADNFKNEKVKQTIVYTMALNYILTNGDKQTEELMTLVRKVVTDPELIADFEKQISTLDPVSVGFVSPDFKAVDMQGKEFSLKDFSGKYIYVDVWASWCKPCRQEQKAMKDLKKLFEGRRIAFVSLSVDEDKAAWQSAVKEDKLVGDQLWMGKGTEFQQIYNIKSIPRFILLDKSGRIINSEMTSPSDDKTALTLRKLKFI